MIVFIHSFNIAFVDFKLVGTLAAKLIRATCAVHCHKPFVVLIKCIAVQGASNALIMERPVRQALILY